MPPKNKGKKSKKQDDDEYWEKAGETIPTQLADADTNGGEVASSSKSKFSGFAALQADGDAGDQEEEEDYGGLMSAIKATSKSKKDKKKSKKEAVSFADGPAPGEGLSEEEAASKGDLAKPKKPVEMTAEDLADEEWGPAKKEKKGKKKKGKKDVVDEEEEVGDAAAPTSEPAEEVVEAKPPPAQMTAEELADEEFGPVKKKGKKDKKKKGGANAEDDNEPAAPPPPTVEVAAPTPTVPDALGDDEEPTEGMGAVLTKKEKEKLKKEREKAKKKAQAAAKKETAAAEEPSAPPKPPSEPLPPPPAKADADEDEEADGDHEPSAASKKKKKKKAAKKDEAPPPSTAKKAPAGISALRAAMEEKKRIEEEAKRKAEEERKRIEEEERLAAEEERKKEEEKARRKEKEKAKRDQAKKEGRLLTPKQKQERAAAEARKKALLDSGVVVEGLQQQQQQAEKPKKVVYGKRQKKGPATASAPGKEVAQLEPESAPNPTTATEDKAKADDDAKSDWDEGSVGDAGTPSQQQPEKETPKAPSPLPTSPAVATPPTQHKEAEVVDADEEVKGDWDATSSEDEEKKPASSSGKKANGVKSPAPTTKATRPEKVASAEKSAPAVKQTSAPAVKQTPNPPTTAPSAPAAVQDEESSSEDDDDEDSDDSDSDDDSDESSDSDGMTATQRAAAQRKAESAARRQQRHEEAMAARNKDDLRSPICCILGHVDTGKTKLLDKIRQTNVQEGEAGGITQQIGATYFPLEAIKQKTAVINTDGKMEYKIPGLLVIDTPGHESFTNLRTRGSSLCNIAILVVDIMHGLEPQTLESLRLLRDRKTPFIVALNKIDRLYGWKATPNNAFRDSLAQQPTHVQREFEDKVQKTILAFAEQGLNSVLYYENKNLGRNVSIVPTSAITGEGIPDMIMLLVNLTQQRMSERLMYLSELECTVLEVKVIEGLGTTIDVVLSNGVLREGDKIVICGLNGPIVTQVRALLTPQPLRELRIKSQYVHHKEVKAALGIKIAAPDLEKAIAGSRLLVCGPDDDEDDLRDEVMSDLTSLMDSIDKSGRGVCVQASTLGSLEALLDFLKSSKIPVSGINIGPVHKKDIMRSATMLEKAKELACILCFDVSVDKEAEKLAEEMGIRLFKADIIYHLFDAFTAFNAEIVEAKRRDQAPQAIWPCRLKTIAAFAKRDPIILGVDILDGSLRVGTPLCVVKVDPTTQKREIIDLGRITSLEINHKTQEVVKKSQAGGGVAVKIESAVYQATRMFGRHFDEKDEIISHITRASIDVLKSTFKEDVSKEEWVLIKGLKAPLGIQ